MARAIRFSASRIGEIQEVGLSTVAIAKIFNGTKRVRVSQQIMACPDWARDFISQEYEACEITFRAIETGWMQAPDPMSGVSTVARASFVPSEAQGTSAVFVVFGEMEKLFCLAFAGPSSRPTHLVIPGMQCVIYHWDVNYAATASAHLDHFLETKSKSLPPITGHRRRIAILDFIPNFGHQAMNQLSGLQRLLDLELVNCIDEIWVAGIEFYGATEAIFPELSNKIRRMPRNRISDEVGEARADVFKIGSNMLTSGLRSRILRFAESAYPSSPCALPRSPVLAVTLRSGGRKCRNLPDVIGQIVSALANMFPQIGVILDGYVFPEGAMVAESSVVTALSVGYYEQLRHEAELSRQVAARLPNAVLLRNTLGMPMLQSLSVLRSADAYFAHVGTLQHKLAWFGNIHGVVHGPLAELGRDESGPYSSEVGFAPIKIDKNAVIDIPVDTNRGQGFWDYEICDVSGVIRSLEEILSKKPTIPP